MDKDRRVSIETISAQFDVSVGTIHTIIREELKMRKVVPRVLRVDQKERRYQDNREMVKLINQMPQFLMLWWSAMKAGSTAMTRRSRDRVPRGSIWFSQTQERQTHKLLTIPFLTALAWSTCTGFFLILFNIIDHIKSKDKNCTIVWTLCKNINKYIIDLYILKIIIISYTLS